MFFNFKITHSNKYWQKENSWILINVCTLQKVFHVLTKIMNWAEKEWDVNQRVLYRTLYIFSFVYRTLYRHIKTDSLLNCYNTSQKIQKQKGTCRPCNKRPDQQKKKQRPEWQRLAGERCGTCTTRIKTCTIITAG